MSLEYYNEYSGKTENILMKVKANFLNNCTNYNTKFGNSLRENTHTTDLMPDVKYRSLKECKGTCQTSCIPLSPKIEICPEMQVNKIHALYDKHHKVSSFLKLKLT